MRRTLVLAVLAAALCAPAARGAVVMGLAAEVDGAGAPPREEAARIAAAGVAWVREDLEWRRVQPRPGAFDWSVPDRIFAAAADAGLRVLPILDDTPCWAAGPGAGADCAQALPAADGAYAAFVAAAAARYGPGGRFWLARPPSQAGLAPSAFELYNEPYLGRPDPVRYAQLVRAAVAAGRAANPRTAWLAAATTLARAPDGGWVDWAGGMAAAVPDLGRWVDGLAIHVYPGARPAADGVRFVADVQAAYRARGVDRPAWVTEAGYAACRDPVDPGRCAPGATLAAREAGKARLLGELVASLRLRPGVAAVFTYTLREYDDPYYGTFGLLDPLTRPLPALAAFRAAAGPATPPVWTWPPPALP